jgi:hypothetical protein
MDPDATLKLVRDAALPLDERAAAAVDLLTWLAKGGFTTEPGCPSECKAIILGYIDTQEA